MLSIRKATPQGARRIAEINIASWRAAYTGLLDDDLLANLSVDDRERGWRERLDDSAVHAVLVAEMDGALVGYALTERGRDVDLDPDATPELASLYLDPAAWGKGVGEPLMDAAIADLQQRGFAEVVLWVLEGNERAIRFYERAGWHDDGARKSCFPSFESPAIRYRRPLR